MAKRLFEDNNAWDDVASRCNNEVEALFAAVLAKVEAELGEPVDLRDFHFVGANALASFVAELSIQRRLGEGDEAPRDKSYYPRLNDEKAGDDWIDYEYEEINSGEEQEASLLSDGAWRCGVMLDGSNCLYNEASDPMHDECINCGEPEERK